MLGERPSKEAIELARRGAVVSDELGLTVLELTPRIARDLQASRGVVVFRVVPDGFADGVGIQVNDVIIALDHQPIEDLDDFVQAIEDLDSDNPVHIQLKRGRTTFSVEVQ